MRSSEVAELAGVTVRTLRHYHQVGVLPEPPRGPNGYRDYDLGTVALLLRIRRLAELGVPLHRVGAMLGAVPDDVTLDEIDAELAATVERLQDKRAQIARLRASGTRADLPEEVAGLVALAPSGSSGLLGELDRDVLLLLLRLVGSGPEQAEVIGDLAAALREPRDDARLVAATLRFESLPADASVQEVEQTAAAMAVVLTPYLERFAESATSRAVTAVRPEWLPDVGADARLNVAQQRAWRRLVSLLEEDARA